MTITTLDQKQSFAGDDTLDPRNLLIIFYAAGDLVVREVDDTTGAEVLLVLGTNYVADASAGTITPVTLWASGKTYHVERQLSYVQTHDYISGDRFPAQSHELGLDRLTLVAQDLRSWIDRAMTIPSTDPEVGEMALPDKDTRKGQMLKFDDVTGRPAVVDPSDFLDGSAITVSAAAIDLLDEATFAAMLTKLNGVENAGGVVRIQVGTAATRAGIAPATFGAGLYLESDRRKLWWSDGATWNEVVSEHTQATLPTPTAASVGRLVVETDNKHLQRWSGSAFEILEPLLPRGYVDGFEHALLTGSPQSVTVGPGMAITWEGASRRMRNAIFSSTMAKNLVNAGGWQQGAGLRGRPVADALGTAKWHHLFLIVKPDGTVDFGFDDSITAANLLASGLEAHAAGFRSYQHISSFYYIDGVDHIQDQQQCGNRFETLAHGQATNLAALADNTLVAVRVPPGIECLWEGAFHWDVYTSLAVIVGPPNRTAAATLYPAATWPGRHEQDGIGFNFRHFQSLTNAAAQVRYRNQGVGTNATVTVMTHAWTHYRGRSA